MTANDRPVVTRKGEGSANTGQSGGLKLMTGVGPQNTPATKLWFGTAGNPPGFRSLPHHHGEAETGAYVLAGRARIFWGENYSEFVDLSAGDFMFVPPLIHHLECNMSTTEELWWLACRTPENIVVNLPDIDDSILAGYRRV
jgi:uncharacterized RmlC-like cupin family protein